MKARILTFFKYALPLVVAFLLLKFYVFEQISLADMVQEFRQANYNWVVLSGVMLLLAHMSRAHRWNLLMQPLGYRPGLFQTFLAVMVGYFANLILPRMGEVTRCGILQRMERVPLHTSFGTVVAERIFDVIMLLLLLSLNFILEFNRLSTFFMDFFSSKFSSLGNLSQNVYIIFTCIIILGLFVLIALYKYRSRFTKLAFFAKIRTFVKGMLEGVLSVRKLDRKWDFALQTILIWIFYYGASYSLTFALPDTPRLTMLAGLTILMMGGLGMAAPVQGGTGPFHILVSSALLLYGWNQEDGLVLATFIWASQTLLTLAVGGICFIISIFMTKPATEQIPAQS
ncbi:lysylphosphatidylglycerol synthase transmembrane domain-containing protein [Rhodocytophaga rosea]|uniref:lysylphosphatidylglycerol synthase transmembrane domain-containing protein n=1 Tax=Rhodocytophaga rosea TaxID=2704465 RepID=UPI001E31D3B6|nr:lysylphosphatidylglycerol synthase transmembrane domain-containing protein [Rhodocytophaga rosea]